MDAETIREPLSSQDVNVKPETEQKLRPPSKLPMSSARKPGPMKRKAEDDIIDPRQHKFTKKFDGANAGDKFRQTLNFDGRPSAIGTRASKTNTFLDSRPSSIGTRSQAATSKTSARPPVNRAKPGVSVSSRTNSYKPTTTLKRSTSGPVGTTSSRMGKTKEPVSNSKAPAITGSKKRPAWDLKGRVHDMEEIISKSMQNASTNASRIQALEARNAQLEGDNQYKETAVHEVSREKSTLEQKLRSLEESTSDLKRRHANDLEDLQIKNGRLERQKEMLEGEISAATQEITGLKTTVAQLTSARAGLDAELSTTKIQLEQAREYGQTQANYVAELKEKLAQRDSTIEEMSGRMIAHETERRKLHNVIQELKGNIRVFCRVRPLLAGELKDNEDGVITHINFPDPDGRILEMDKLCGGNLNDTKGSGKGGNKPYEFNFDRVFDPDASQADVFSEISQLVQSALDGYNVCIFAYGQTGSGKTYTMEGQTDNPDSMGMIPRAIHQIFQTSKDLEDKGWKYDLEASFLEIYNETLRDLLGDGKNEVKHEIKLTGPNSNDVCVTNLTTENVTSQEQVRLLMGRAVHNRSVGETKLNERSSRSHSVFRMKINGNNSKTGENCIGTLNLVDLAGSERLKESGAQGARLKETLAINKSLSNLGNVIMALANKDPHIPYRNSKLTHLLQNSLGGNSKTLMFVNVSPREDSFNETLNSVRFAAKVNQCNIGTAQKKVK